MSARIAGVLLGLMASGLVLFAAPSTAFASWRPPVPQVAVLLGYGAAYGGCTHWGVDLSATAGESVSSPSGGTVTFAGRIPADGGGTCQAVTIETADGLRITLLPLTDSLVSEGACIRAGDEVGSVAASGDSSSAVTHLHLSLRRGETYLDPAALLPASTPTQPEPSATSTTTGAEEQGVPPASAPIAAASSSGTASASESFPGAQAAAQSATAVSQTSVAVQTRHAFRMPRDAQEQMPLVLHSAQPTRILGVRLPSAVPSPPGAVVMGALLALLAAVAALVAPRRAFGRA